MWENNGLIWLHEARPTEGVVKAADEGYIVLLQAIVKTLQTHLRFSDNGCRVIVYAIMLKQVDCLASRPVNRK